MRTSTHTSLSFAGPALSQPTSPLNTIFPRPLRADVHGCGSLPAIAGRPGAVCGALRGLRGHGPALCPRSHVRAHTCTGGCGCGAVQAGARGWGASLCCVAELAHSLSDCAFSLSCAVSVGLGRFSGFLHLISVPKLSVGKRFTVFFSPL